MFPMSLTWTFSTQLPGRGTPSFWSAGKLNDLRVREDSADPKSEPPTLDLTEMDDIETLYDSYSNVVAPEKTLIMRGLHRLSKTDSFFYTDVTTGNGDVLRALVDSGSMACTLSEAAGMKLSQSTPNITKNSAEGYVIVGCGGHLVTPCAMYDLTVSVYGYRVIVPVLVVPGQTNDMILGSSAIKWLKIGRASCRERV